jgi:hypothetical protein
MMTYLNKIFNERFNPHSTEENNFSHGTADKFKFVMVPIGSQQFLHHARSSSITFLKKLKTSSA